MLNAQVHLNKDKKTRGWSYPLGVERLSIFLSESKRSFDLFFYYRDYLGLELYREDSLIKLKRVNAYSSIYDYRKLMTLIWVDNLWGVSIFAVRSKEKKIIKFIIEDFAKPRIVNWLNQDRTNTWFEEKHIYQIAINKDFSKICYWEIHNSEIIDAKFEDIPPETTGL